MRVFVSEDAIFQYTMIYPSPDIGRGILSNRSLDAAQRNQGFHFNGILVANNQILGNASLHQGYGLDSGRIDLYLRTR